MHSSGWGKKINGFVAGHKTPFTLCVLLVVGILGAVIMFRIVVYSKTMQPYNIHVLGGQVRDDTLALTSGDAVEQVFF